MPLIGTEGEMKKDLIVDAGNRAAMGKKKVLREGARAKARKKKRVARCQKNPNGE